MKLTINELQQFNSSVLKEVVQLCDDADINYIGMFGTMLGAARHQGTIPWDADVDIAIPVSQFDSFVQLMKNKLDDKFRLDYRDDKKNIKLFPRVGLKGYSTKYLHVDVYPIIGLPNSIEKQKRLFYWIRKVVGIYGAKVYKYNGKKALRSRIIRILTFCITPRMLAFFYDSLCKKYLYEESEVVGCSNSSSGYKRTFKKEEIENTMLVDYEGFKIRIPQSYDRILTVLYGDYMKYPSEKSRKIAISTEYNVDSI